MKVAIVDNQETYITLITKVIQTNKPLYELDTYIDSYTFLKNANKYDLVFLDIDMPNIDGIEVSQFLTDLEIRIIFVTSHSERMIDAFGKNVIGFIQKEALEQGIEKVFKKLEDKQQCITLKAGIHDVKIYLNEIEYIEYALRDVTFHLLNQKDIFIKEISLKDILSKLDGDFVLVNRTTIVNSKHIINIKDNIIFLKTKNIKASRRNKKNVQMKMYEKRLAYARNIRI